MTDIPNPKPESVTVWLKNGLDRKALHDNHWKEVNQRFHGITRAVRPYILKNFKPEEQAAAFDGLTLALAAVAHFEDIERLEHLMRALAPAPTNHPKKAG